MTGIRLLATVGIALAGVGPVDGQVSVATPPAGMLADQRPFPDTVNACAPASLLNFLACGGDRLAPARESIAGRDSATRLRFVIERYFESRKSVVFPGWSRWGVHGVQDADLATSILELLDESGTAPVEAAWLEKRKGETAADHQARIHGLIETSLRRGVGPILSLRAYRGRLPAEGREGGWQLVRQHFVVIVALPDEHPPGALGFPARAIDSNGAREVSLRLFTEPAGRPFRALLGTEETGAWLDGRPFLLVHAPESIRALRPARLEWGERFHVTASFLIGDF